jgi:serine/threonine-protein kinase
MRSALESALATAQPVTEGGVAGPEPTRAPRSTEPATAPLPVAGVVAGRRRRGVRKAIALSALILVIVALLGVVLVKALDGPRTVGVPALVGRPLAQAQRLAGDRGLKVSVRSVQSARPKGLVLAQDPRAGIRIQSGETVYLTVSSGVPPQPPDVLIPDLRGFSLGDAESALARLGVGIGDVIKESSKDVNPGEVLGTSPPAGSTVKQGDKVDIVVAKEPKKEHGNNQEGH